MTNENKTTWQHRSWTINQSINQSWIYICRRLPGP